MDLFWGKAARTGGAATALGLQPHLQVEIRHMHLKRESTLLLDFGRLDFGRLDFGQHFLSIFFSHRKWD